MPRTLRTPPRKRSWKRRWFTRVALTTLIVLTVGGVSFWIWYAHCKAELDAEIAQVRARGEPVEFADLASRRHDQLREAKVMTVLKSVARPPQAFYDALVGPVEYEPGGRRKDPGLPPPGDYPELRQAVAANRAAIDRIVALAREGDCRFSYDYATKSPFLILLPHVHHLHEARSLMDARVIQSLGTGDPRGAVRTVDDMFHVTELLRHDPMIICQLARGRDHGKALDVLQLVMEHVPIDAMQRDQFDATLAEIEKSFRLRPALIAERAMTVTVIGTAGSEEFASLLRFISMDRPNGTVQRWASQLRHSSQSRWWGSFWYRPWLFQEKTFALRTMGRLANLVDQPGPVATRNWNNAWNKTNQQLKDYPINALVFPGLAGIRDVGLQHRQRVIAARLALRADAFRQRQGKLPDTLDAVLSPQMPSLPAGLISGQPLKYQPTGKGFRIFDTDPNGKAVGEFKVLFGK